MRFLWRMFRLYRVIRQERRFYRHLSKAIRTVERLEKLTARLKPGDFGEMDEAVPIVRDYLERAYKLLDLSHSPLRYIPEMKEVLEDLKNPGKSKG